VARGVSLGLLITLALVLLGVAAALGVYAYYAVTLPSPQELHQRATAFKSTKILDRHGRLLFEVFDPLGGRRTLVKRDQMPQVLIDAVVSTEDATFYTNPGWNPFSIARALYDNLREGEVVRGGSTITQQLVKNVYLTDERTYTRKIQEAILATEITRRYSKDDILELYLNEVYFGNLAYGIEAASETYFAKPVSALTLPEAALLAGFIQSPAYYDPYINPDMALRRRETVLRLMFARGAITEAAFLQARRAPLSVAPRRIEMQAPHMVMYVRELLEHSLGTEMLYKGGLQVYTTLDLDIQCLAEAAARDGLAQLEERDASNAALVALDPLSGDVLAMVGSVDFFRPGDGQVNVALSLRQPGSTLKPFTYLAAFERGWTPSTMVMDLAQEFPDGANPPYRPHNYDKTQWGPISVRTALANSRNIPAVATLHRVGLPAMLGVCHRLGIASLNRPDYGLSLTLGGGEATLLEVTGAYGALANGGFRVQPRVILRIDDHAGKVVHPQTLPLLQRAMDPRHAYWLTDILSDRVARQRAFGVNNYLDLPFTSAVKTGTTDDYRDSWAVGYTPQLVTGVWVGNNDNSPMDRLTGARGAALIWRDFMTKALENRDHPEFARPDGLIDIQVCPVSGLKHTERCPAARTALFWAEAPPQECTVHREVGICLVSGKAATEFCPEETVERRRYEDYGPEWDGWAQARGMVTPPRESCDVHGPVARVEIQAPGQTLASIVPLWGRTEVADFALYYVEFGQGREPWPWHRLTADMTAPVLGGALAEWDARTLPEGDYTLRLIVRSQGGQEWEARTVVQILGPAPVATPTWPPTEMPWPTPTDAPPATETPGPTPTATEPPSPTATATLAPTTTPTDTPDPTATPTATAASATPTEAPPPTATATAPLSPSTSGDAAEAGATVTAQPTPG
jgi:1A family penicillin-binding protein